MPKNIIHVKENMHKFQNFFSGWKFRFLHEYGIDFTTLCLSKIACVYI
jgi:hypothetical protein